MALFIPGCTPATEVSTADTVRAPAIHGVEASDALALSCSGCHDVGGDAIISLDGLDASQIASSLQRYSTETEGATVMHRLVRGYSEQDLRDISKALGTEVEEKGR